MHLKLSSKDNPDTLVVGLVFYNNLGSEMSIDNRTMSLKNKVLLILTLHEYLRKVRQRI